MNWVVAVISTTGMRSAPSTVKTAMMNTNTQGRARARVNTLQNVLAAIVSVSPDCSIDTNALVAVLKPGKYGMCRVAHALGVMPQATHAAFASQDVKMNGGFVHDRKQSDDP